MNDSTIKVLLVEDEPAHIKLVRRAFDSLGDSMQLEFCGSLREARQFLNHSTPDLLMVDLKLPDGSGMDLLANDIDSAEVPVLVLTSHGNEETAVEAMKRGALDYVVKSDELFNGIGHVVERALREWSHIAERRLAEQALRESEEHLRSVLDTATDYIMSIDLDGIIRYINRVESGRTLDDVIASRVLDYFQTDEQEQFQRAMQHVRATGEPVDIQNKVTSTDGETRSYSSRMGPVMDGDEVTGFTVCSRDITEQLNAEEALRLRDAELAHVSRVSTMGEMASAMAHEINQPLAAIANYSGQCAFMLESEKMQPIELPAILRKIDCETHRASSIIKRLRAFVKKSVAHQSSVEMNSLIKESAQLLDFTDDWRMTAVRYDLDDSLPVIQADSIQLQQVLVNLLCNASEAMVDLEMHDRILTVRTMVEGDSIVIEISNHGDTIPDGLREKIFEPYYTSKAEGLGMGLSISRTIIKSHGGTIGASTANGETTFRVELPVA